MSTSTSGSPPAPHQQHRQRRLKTHISPNIFIHVPAKTDDAHSRPILSSGQRRRVRLLFFITGNPGLVGYYVPFLSLLARFDGQNGEREREDLVIASMSLGGFELVPQATEDEDEDEWGLFYPLAFRDRISGLNVNGGAEEDGIAAARDSMKDRLFTLREQIELSYARLQDMVERLRLDGGINARDNGSTPEPVEVVLKGHSVGAYICLEMVRLWHERKGGRETGYSDRSDFDVPLLSTDIGPSPTEPLTVSTPPWWKATACILLTPTVQDIHLSPSGLVATPLLTHLTFLPALAQLLLSNLLLRVVPAGGVSWLVARLTGMEAGSHGLDATLKFLNSARGVRQALFLARCEMREIREDAWGDEVWGVTHARAAGDEEEDMDASGGRSGSGRPRMFFWFARTDHWVAEATKAAILKGKAAGVGVERDHVDDHEKRSAMKQDEDEEVRVQQQGQRIRIRETAGLIHAWCLKQSEVVARQVGQWLEEVLDEDI